MTERAEGEEKAEYVVINNIYTRGGFATLAEALKHVRDRAKSRFMAGIKPTQNCAIYAVGTTPRQVLKAPTFTKEPVSDFKGFFDEKQIFNLVGANLNKFLAGFLIVALVGGFFAYQTFVKSRSQNQNIEEVDLSFDPEGPFALLSPRRDGNATILNLKRTSSYDRISYELAYTSQPEEVKVGSGDEISAGGVDRGVMGDIKTADKKGEYEQEILFGTCSKNICKYDKGVENGTLTLHIRKGGKAYKMITQWHLQAPDVALGNLTSGDGHFTYKAEGAREELALAGFTMINDLIGAPKLPEEKSILGKVYAVNLPLTKQLPKGTVTIELADKPAIEAKIARFDDSQNKWVEYDTKVDGSKLSASVDTNGIFAVLTSKK